MPGDPAAEAAFLMSKYKSTAAAVDYACFVLYEVVEKDATKAFWKEVIIHLKNSKNGD